MAYSTRMMEREVLKYMKFDVLLDGMKKGIVESYEPMENDEEICVMRGEIDEQFSTSVNHPNFVAAAQDICVRLQCLSAKREIITDRIDLPFAYVNYVKQGLEILQLSSQLGIVSLKWTAPNIRKWLRKPSKLVQLVRKCGRSMNEIEFFDEDLLRPIRKCLKTIPKEPCQLIPTLIEEHYIYCLNQTEVAKIIISTGVGVSKAILLENDKVLEINNGSLYEMISVVEQELGIHDKVKG